MSQPRFKQLIPHTEEATKDKPDDLNYHLARCHQGPRSRTINCAFYGPIGAAIHACKHSQGSPLLLGRVPAILTKSVPRLAGNKSFVDEVSKALEQGSSTDAGEQLFEKKLVEGTNGKEFAYYLNPRINKDGLAYSCYLIHRAFNRAHIYGNADYINIDIIKRCSSGGHPDLLEVFIDRLKGLSHGLGRFVNDEEDICTYYVRFISRKSYEDVANNTIFIQHLFDIEKIDPEFHDAMRECQRNLMLQNANMVYQL